MRLVSIRKSEVIDSAWLAVIFNCIMCRLEIAEGESPFAGPLARLRVNFADAKFRLEIDAAKAGPNVNGVKATSKACANGARNRRVSRDKGRAFAKRLFGGAEAPPFRKA
jgi:hypothetical protein